MYYRAIVVIQRRRCDQRSRCTWAIELISWSTLCSMLPPMLLLDHTPFMIQTLVADSVHSLPSTSLLVNLPFEERWYQSGVDSVRDGSSLNTYGPISVDLLYGPGSGPGLIHFRDYARLIIENLVIDFVIMLDSCFIFLSDAFVYQVLFP